MGDKHLFVCAHVCECYLLTTFLPHLPFCFALILETLSHHRFMDPDRTFFQAGWSFRWSFWWHLLQWFSTHFVPKPHQRESQMAFRRTFSNLRFTGIEIACISLIRHFHIKLPQHSFRVLLSKLTLQFASYHDTISSSQQMIHLGWELLTSNRPVASQCFLLTVWFSTHTFSILMTISQGLDVSHFNIFASWVTAQKNMGSLWQGFFSLTACRLLTNECLQNTVQ